MVRNTRSTRSAVPAWIEPMLAKPDGGRLPTGSAIVYEYKVDGYRCSMGIAPDGTTVLTSRNGNDFTAEFPTLTGVLTDALEGEAALLDGEIVVYDEHGAPDFGLLQQRRGRHTRRTGHAEPVVDVDVRFLAFDIVRLGDIELLDQPYEERRRILTALPMPDPHRVAVIPAVTFDELAADRRTPHDFLGQAAAIGHEGLVAKVRNSVYLPGKRSDTWKKHPFVNTNEVIICGWRPGQGSLAGTVGGLLLGGHDPATGDLVYLGDVGTGLTTSARDDLRDQLTALERSEHPFAVTPPREDIARARWVDPVLVGEVVYRQFTRGAGRLRHTSWRGLRIDKAPADVVAPRADPRPSTTPAPAAPPSRPTAPSVDEPVTPLGQKVVVQAGNRQLTLSNLDKPLYPDGFTKGEVINYYSRIAPVLLPHLAGRPVTFIRFPNGVGGQQFFEKNVSPGAPEWLPTVTLPSSGSRGRGETIEYVLLEELPALVWAANLAALELHVPQWTVAPDGTRRAPDRLVFDLDPGPGTTIVECCRVAERLRELLQADGLTAFAKTSGSKGMQLYCSITTDQPAAPSAYAKTLALHLANETPELVTATMAKAKRTGKVFIDWSQNNPAKTTVAPYSLRGRELPTASTPITWAEVNDCRRAVDLLFTADDVLDRVDEHGDLLAELLDSVAPLPTP